MAGNFQLYAEDRDFAQMFRPFHYDVDLDNEKYLEEFRYMMEDAAVYERRVWWSNFTENPFRIILWDWKLNRVVAEFWNCGSMYNLLRSAYELRALRMMRFGVMKRALGEADADRISAKTQAVAENEYRKNAFKFRGAVDYAIRTWPEWRELVDSGQFPDGIKPVRACHNISQEWGFVFQNPGDGMNPVLRVRLLNCKMDHVLDRNRHFTGGTPYFAEVLANVSEAETERSINYWNDMHRKSANAAEVLARELER